jgi:Domain of unknown function (DUF1788)
MNNDITKLIKYLEDPSFQNPETGKLFHPTYIYLYNAEDEYKMQEDLQTILGRLKRPNHFLDCLLVNLYEELIDYLKSNRIFDTTVFDEILKREESDAAFAQQWVIDKVDNAVFLEYLTKKINDHFGDISNEKRVYLLIHGVGDVFPYLRASDFLKRIESLVKTFKVILFYPGEYSDKYYNLFGNIRTDNIYRANLLNQLI